jgi:hypothetical protein
MKHQIGGATQAQQGMTFQITLIFTFYVLPWEPDLSQNVRIDPVLKLTDRWEPGRFSLGDSHLQWEPSIQFFWQFDISGSHWPVLTENQAENWRQFSANGWEPPNTGMNMNRQ